MPVHLTHCHLSFVYNQGRAPELLAAIDRARAEGVEVTMDDYPYLAGNTTLHAFLPSWMHEGGTEATLTRLRSAEIRDRLRHEMEVVGSDGIGGVPMGWEMVQISGIMGEHDPVLEGMRLPDAAARAGTTPFDFAVDLLNSDAPGGCLHYPYRRRTECAKHYAASGAYGLERWHPGRRAPSPARMGRARAVPGALRA